MNLNLGHNRGEMLNHLEFGHNILNVSLGIKHCEFRIVGLVIQLYLNGFVQSQLSLWCTRIPLCWINVDAEDQPQAGGSN